VIDADHNVECAAILDRGGHDYAFGAAIEITLELLLLQEFAGAFEHDITAKIAPGNIGGGCSLGKAEALVRNRDGFATIHADRRVPEAMHAIKLKQMRGCLDAALQLVDMNDIKAVAGTRIAIRSVNPAK